MTFLAAAFMIMWLLIALFVVFMWVRQRQLETELASLEEQMAERRRSQS